MQQGIMHTRTLCAVCTDAWREAKWPIKDERGRHAALDALRSCACAPSPVNPYAFVQRGRSTIEREAPPRRADGHRLRREKARQRNPTAHGRAGRRARGAEPTL